MHFVSVEFPAFVACALVLFYATDSPAAKRGVLFAANLAFVAWLTAEPSQMIPIGFLLGAGFLLVRMLQADPRSWLVRSAVCGSVALFVYLKQYSVVAAFLPELGFNYSTVGLSYLLFRILHLLIDTYEGGLPGRISFTSYFNYCCSFLCWLSGPIQRYEDYAAQEAKVASREPSTSEVQDALSRVVSGIFKIAIVSAVLLEIHELTATVPLHGASPIHFVATLGIAASAFTLYMYYNFAGYMDVVIGIGALFGFRLPENFNRPFAAKNFLEFWSRWHITLSNWFKFYIFNASVRALTTRWGSRKSTPYLGVVAYFITFAVMGIWHGSTPIFFLYGLFLGGGVSANKLYEVEARKRMGKDRFQRLRANRFYAHICQGSVFAYFTAALLCFWATPKLGTELLDNAGLALLAYTSLTLVAAASFGIGAALRATTSRLPTPALPTRDAPLGAMLLGAKAYAVGVLILMQTTAIPDFVYVPF